jgi:hypothetical protein
MMKSQLVKGVAKVGVCWSFIHREVEFAKIVEFLLLNFLRMQLP